MATKKPSPRKLSGNLSMISRGFHVVTAYVDAATMTAIREKAAKEKRKVGTWAAIALTEAAKE